MCFIHLLHKDGKLMNEAEIERVYADEAFVDSIRRKATRLCAPEAAEERTFKRARDKSDDLYQHVLGKKYLTRRIQDISEMSGNTFIFVCLNWEKAFDKIDQNKLIEALYRMNINEK